MSVNYVKSLFICLVILIGIGCSKDVETTFTDNDISASFKVNGTDFNKLDEMRWFRSGL